jgi:SAM-dependent methyltransferase
LDQQYWNDVSRNYEREVLSVWETVSGNGLLRCLEQAAQRVGTLGRAADLGCGVGKFLPWLAQRFVEVEACDYATQGLQRARLACERDGWKQVRFHQVDLTLDPMPFEPVDLALCVNVLLMPCLDARLRAWRTVCNQVVDGGSLVLVVPSLESIMMEQHLERDQLLLEGCTCEQALVATLPEQSRVMELHQGVHRLEGCPTKHYLKEELLALLAEHGFEILTVFPIGYGAGSGVASTTWDWCVHAKRQASP